MTFLANRMTSAVAFFLLAGSISPDNAIAQTSAQDIGNQTFISIVCPSIGQLATGIMELRQEGQDMSTVITTLTAGQKMPAKGVIMDLIISAYEFPQMSVAENRRNAVVEFSNDAQVDCYTKDWAAMGLLDN